MAARSNSPKPDAIDIVPREGERGLIVGHTGSGKTALSTWLNERRPRAPIVIYDTKGEPKFDALPRSAATPDLGDVERLLDVPELDYVIWRPEARTANDPEELDDALLHHYDNWQADAHLDELRSFHNRGHAGPGLMALYTRGRSRGIGTLGGVQRPAWISRDALSEAQHFYIFDMIDARDRKRMAEIVPNLADLERPPKYHFHYWRQGMAAPRLMAPIPLESKYDTGYTDNKSPSDSGMEGEAPAASRHIWL